MQTQTDPYKQLIEDRKDPYRELISSARFAFVLLAVLLCFIIVFTKILIGVNVYGASMQPTLHTGDYLFVCTLSQPERGDIVVVPNPTPTSSGEKYLIKRVIGLPGDTLKAEDGVLYRKEAGQEDFSVVAEEFLGELWVNNNDIAPVTVQPGMMYVMGDNRNDSLDSRILGQFSIDDMLGVVTHWSVEHKDFLTAVFGFLQP